MCSSIKMINGYLLRNSSAMFAGGNKFTVLSRGLKYLKPPPEYKDVEFPERPKLRVMEKGPVFPKGVKAPKMQKNLRFIRGPETVHNTLLYNQYGIAAVNGGRLQHVHFEMIRTTFAEKLDYKRMFAIWRVDSPWQPCTKRPVGMTLGGGKGHSIHHYVTPVKAHRVIVEVGGKCDFEEVEYILQRVANKLPFKARAISKELLEEEAEKEKRLEALDIQKFPLDYVIKNNMLGCRRWVKDMEYKYFGKYP